MPKIQTTKVYYELDQAIKAGYATVSEQGSSRSGKTYNTVIWLCVYMMNHAGLRLSVVRKTLTALRGSVLLDFKSVLVDMGLWDWKLKAFNKSDFTFTFPNGSWIEFFSTDDEQKLRGRKRDICYVNEANELSQLEWQQLKMRTTMFTIADYNPSFSDEHWLVDVNHDPRTYHFITTYKDNPFLEQTIVDEIESLQYKNKSLWQVYGLGMQAVIEGLIYTNVEFIDEIPQVAKKRHWRGCDWGYSLDPTAIEDVYYHDGCLYVDEICYQTGMLASDIIRVLREHDGAVETICDSADPRLIQEVYRGGCNVKPVTKYPGSVMAGIAKMQEFKKIYVTNRSTNIIKEFKNYVWMQDKEGKWLNQPAGGLDHCFVADTKILTTIGEKRIADIVAGDLVLTSGGYRQVLENHNNGRKKVFRFRLTFDNFTTEVECTPDHKIKTTKGWKQIQDLKPGDILYTPYEATEQSRRLCSTEKYSDFTRESDISRKEGAGSTSLYGNTITGPRQKAMRFITKISTALTTIYRTWSVSQKRNTISATMIGLLRKSQPQNNLPILSESEKRQALGTAVKKEGSGIVSTENGLLCLSNQKNSHANAVVQNSIPKKETQNSARITVSQNGVETKGLITKQESANIAERSSLQINTQGLPIVQEVALLDITVVSNTGGTDKDVYDLTVEGIHEYVANGIVVHNCLDGIRYVVSEKILGGRPKPFNATKLANIAY